MELAPAPADRELAWQVQISRGADEEAAAARVVWTRDEVIGEADGLLRWVRSSELSQETWERGDDISATRVGDSWITWRNQSDSPLEAAGGLESLRRTAHEDGCCSLVARLPPSGEAGDWRQVTSHELSWKFCERVEGLTEWQQTVTSGAGTYTERWRRAPGLDQQAEP